MACTKCDAECNSCNSTCNDCNTACNTCNRSGCQVCQNCVSGCQVYCEYHQDLATYAGSFAFSPRPSTSVRIGPEAGMFTRASWNAAANWISERANVGSLVSGGSTVPTYNGNVFTAAEFNRISSEVGGPTVHQNQLITASLFITLQNRMNSLNISAAACNANNTCGANCNGCNSCNTTCNICNGTCDSCMGCYGCVRCQTTCNSCVSCDAGCEGHTPTPGDQ